MSLDHLNVTDQKEQDIMQEIALTLDECSSEGNDLVLDTLNTLDHKDLGNFIEKKFSDGAGTWQSWTTMAKDSFYYFCVEATIDHCSQLLKNEDGTDLEIEMTVDGTTESKTLDGWLEAGGGVDGIRSGESLGVEALQIVLGIAPDRIPGPQFFSHACALLGKKTIDTFQVEGYSEDNPYAFSEIRNDTIQQFIATEVPRDIPTGRTGINRGGAIDTSQINIPTSLDNQNEEVLAKENIVPEGRTSIEGKQKVLNKITQNMFSEITLGSLKTYAGGENEDITYFIKSNNIILESHIPGIKIGLYGEYKNNEFVFSVNAKNSRSDSKFYKKDIFSCGLYAGLNYNGETNRYSINKEYMFQNILSSIKKINEEHKKMEEKKQLVNQYKKITNSLSKFAFTKDDLFPKESFEFEYNDEYYNDYFNEFNNSTVKIAKKGDGAPKFSGDAKTSIEDKLKNPQITFNLDDNKGYFSNPREHNTDITLNIENITNENNEIDQEKVKDEIRKHIKKTVDSRV